MTDLLERAIAAVRALPPETQDDIARMIFLYADANEDGVIKLTPEEEADLVDADAEVARGELATDEQMRSIWAKHRV